MKEIIKAEDCFVIFEKSIADYHGWNSLEKEAENPFPVGVIQHILYKKNWIDTVQWHLEDEIRRPDISPQEALAIKRKIDASNQDRTDLVELIDFLFFEDFKNVTALSNSGLNTETPAWALDRLSILALKIYHMQVETERVDASENHRQNCMQKLEILWVQKTDLMQAINELLSDLASGKKVMKLYKQMKMYNDPALNPVLYKTNS